VGAAAHDAWAGFAIALLTCVLVGRFVWNGIDHPASPAQRVGAVVILVVMAAGAVVAGLVFLANQSSGA
jgi:hypothetical protein